MTYITPLTKALQHILPTANLSKTLVPLLSTTENPFYLWLIDENFCHQDLTPDIIEKLWENCPYWVFAWASGQVLADYVLKNADLVRDKIVMDFGAGSGIVGLASLIAGVKQVICCDIDETSLLACRANEQLNQAILNGKKMAYLRDLFDLENQFGIKKVDVLLVADVLYDKRNLPLLDIFLDFAEAVWVADSRVKNFAHAQYQKVTTIENTTTLPDMDEAKQFNQVVIYQSCSPSK